MQAKETVATLTNNIMRDDVIGRLRNTQLLPSKALFPLFEAIVNSIHAIEDSNSASSGKIDIDINRDRQLDGLDEAGSIIGFSIGDNGIGFNEQNYRSFTTADSRFKQDRGGKGVGRFIWLKAFHKVSITSSFNDNGVFHTRAFDFLAQPNPIDNLVVEEASDRVTSTKVELSGIDSRKTGVGTQFSLI